MNSLIPHEAIKVDLNCCLGSGAFGVVYKARYANELVVVKRLKVQSLSKKVEEEFKKEAAILAGLNHPRIVRFLGVSFENEQCSIVLEYLPLGSLYSHYTQKPAYNLSTRLSLAMDVSTGMEFLHQRNPPILHNDLKSPNILLYHDATGALHAKITDFGIAKIKTATATTTSGAGFGAGTSTGIKGTFLWMAPELHNLRAKYRTNSDVYAFGVVMTEIMSWVGPFGIPVPDIKFNEIHHQLTVEKRLPEINLASDVTPGLRNLINRCLALGFNDRPSFADVSASLEDLIEGGDGDVKAAPAPVAQTPNNMAFAALFLSPPATPAAGGRSSFEATMDTIGFKVTETNISERSASSAFSAASSSSGSSSVGVVENKMADLSMKDQLAMKDLMARNASAGQSWLAPPSGTPQRPTTPTSPSRSPASPFASPPVARTPSAAGSNLSTGDTLINPLDTVKNMMERAATLSEAQDFDALERLLYKLVEFAKRNLGESHESTLTAISALADYMEEVHGDAVKIEHMVRKALDDSRRALGNDHRTTLQLMSNVANIYSAQDLDTAAFVLITERAQRSIRVFGENDPDSIGAACEMGVWLVMQGKMDEGETLLKALLKKSIALDKSGESDLTINICNMLGLLYNETKKFSEAEKYLTFALDKLRAKPSDELDESIFITVLQSLSTALWKQLKLNPSEALLMEGISRSVRVLGADAEETKDMTKDLSTVRKLKDYQSKSQVAENRAMLLAEQGDLVKAESILRDCVAAHTKLYGANHAKTMDAKKKLDEVLARKVGAAGGVNVRITLGRKAGSAGSGNMAAHTSASTKKRGFFGFGRK
ncbi:hypothetical protein HDU97_007625 [Phlyctochytrium planicorne]|nr:hypothetical protein HDU97_007625 [Phlyctochytrium planicorne]